MPQRKPDRRQKPQAIALSLGRSNDADKVRLVAFAFVLANAFFFMGFTYLWRALILGRG